MKRRCGHVLYLLGLLHLYEGLFNAGYNVSRRLVDSKLRGEHKGLRNTHRKINTNTHARTTDQPIALNDAGSGRPGARNTNTQVGDYAADVVASSTLRITLAS